MEMMASALQKLASTDSLDEFEYWAKSELRLLIPHAALLVTVGRLYGVGSVPTHRLSVDFPLEMVESLKNAAGALNDPPMYGWFKSQKLRVVHITDVEERGEQRQWRMTLLRYGFHSMMIHGVLDHAKRRFAIFQMCNLPRDSLQESSLRLSLLLSDMAAAVWRISLSKRVDLVRHGSIVGHPTLSLTASELHIIELLAQGLSNKEIARRRGVSDSTVKTQVQRTGAKVGATRRAEIVAIALPLLSPLPPQMLLDYGDDY